MRRVTCIRSCSDLHVRNALALLVCLLRFYCIAFAFVVAIVAIEVFVFGIVLSIVLSSLLAFRRSYGFISVVLSCVLSIVIDRKRGVLLLRA